MTEFRKELEIKAKKVSLEMNSKQEGIQEQVNTTDTPLGAMESREKIKVK